MNGNTHNTKRLITGLVLATALAAPTVPQALAAGHNSYQDGWYGYAVALTKASHSKPTASKLFDRRSPDTIDAALAAHPSPAPQGSSSRFGPPDGWYPYAASLTKASHNATLVDGRSPDTLDAAVQAHAPVVTITLSPGFDWGDFGIGIAAALGAMLLLGMSIRLLAARQSRKQPSPVATA